MKRLVLFLAFVLFAAPAFAVEAPSGYEEETTAVPEPAPSALVPARPPVFQESAGPVEVNPAPSRAAAVQTAPAAPASSSSALQSFENDRPQDRRYSSGVLISMERFVPPAPIAMPLRQYEVEEEAIPAQRASQN